MILLRAYAAGIVLLIWATALTLDVHPLDMAVAPWLVVEAVAVFISVQAILAIVRSRLGR